MKGYYIWFTFSFLFGILAFGLILLGINTPYWVHYRVSAHQAVFPFSFERFRGIYKECYAHPRQIPKDVPLFQDLLGDTCRYTVSEQLLSNSTFTTGGQMYLAVSWGVFVSGGIALVLQAISVPLAGSVPCSNRPDRRILAAGLIMALSSLLHSFGVGLWYAQQHVAGHFVQNSQNVRQTIPVSWRSATKVTYGWSLFISCAGVACSVAATALCLIGYCLAKSDLEPYYYNSRGSGKHLKKRRSRGGHIVYPGSFYTTSSSEYGYTPKHRKGLPLDEQY